MSIPSNSTRYLDAAISTAAWIRANAAPTEHGIRWLPEPDHPEKHTTVSTPPSLYSGSGGIVLFFIELANATGDRSWLDDARLAGDELVGSWRAAIDAPSFIALENVGLDFQFGVGGAAFVLAQLWLATGEKRYRAAAGEIGDEIIARARNDEAGLFWIDQPTLGMGDAGIVLNLLWLSDELERPAFREVAMAAGRRLLAMSEPDPRGGIRWQGNLLEQFGAPAGAYAPNFELGTAGTAFVMAKLYAASHDPAFLEAAKAGADHIRALATLDPATDSALLFYREPDFTDLYYLGYCHGPVGTSRLFYELHRLTGDADDLRWTERFARGITASGLPDDATPGLWNVACQCCGTGGVFDHFTSLALALDDPGHLDYAERLADFTLAKGVDPDGTGLRWYQAWTRTAPDDIAAETGFMIGAAGIGTALLRLHRAKHGRYEALLFPDNPFATRAAG
jgi:lantibiotic modifying enzyme